MLTDSYSRKVVSRLNVKLVFLSNGFTFHTFGWSGATLTYRSNASLELIKPYGYCNLNFGLKFSKISILVRK